ncbi:MAG: hypothetical protein Kow0037_30900 [Calditrichia bacterium]
MTANTKPEVLLNRLADLNKKLNEAIRFLPGKLLLQQILAKQTRLREIDQRLQFDHMSDAQQQINVLYALEQEISEETAAVENLFLQAKMERVSERAASLIRLIRSRYRPDNFPPFQKAWLGHLEQWIDDIRRIHSPARISFLESEIIPKLESMQKELDQWAARLKERLELSEKISGEASRKKKKRFEKLKEKVKRELEQGYLKEAEKRLEKLERKKEFSRVEPKQKQAKLQRDLLPVELFEYQPIEVPDDWLIAGDMEDEKITVQIAPPELPPAEPEIPDSFSALEMESEVDTEPPSSESAARLIRWLKRRLNTGNADFAEWLEIYHYYFLYAREFLRQKRQLNESELRTILELEGELQNRFAENYLQKIEELEESQPRPDFLQPDPLRAFTPYYPVILFHFNSIRLDQWWVLREKIAALLPHHYTPQRVAFKLKKLLPTPVLSREISGCYYRHESDCGEICLDTGLPVTTNFRLILLPTWEENTVLPDLIREDLPGMTIVKCGDWREEREYSASLWTEISANLQDGFENLKSWQGLRQILMRLSHRKVRLVFTAGEGNLISTRFYTPAEGLHGFSPRALEFRQGLQSRPDLSDQPIFSYSNKIFLRAPFRLAEGVEEPGKPELAYGGISLTESLLPFEIFEPKSREKGS